MMIERLEIIPVDLDLANQIVALHHRHAQPVRGHKFSIGCMWRGILVGVAIIGRPVARNLDDGFTLEVTRVATNGQANACSTLYGAARRATFALGYRKLVTYTLKSESGASLRASGYRVVGEVTGRQWSCQSRPRAQRETADRFRWEAAS